LNRERAENKFGIIRIQDGECTGEKGGSMKL
jgi:hypothetical protein